MDPLERGRGSRKGSAKPVLRLFWETSFSDVSAALLWVQEGLRVRVDH